MRANDFILFLLLSSTLYSCKRSRTYENYTHEKGPLTGEITIIGTPQTLFSGSDNLLDVLATNKNKNQLLSRIAYMTSYNCRTLNPNWVAWHLTREHTDGPYPRRGVPYYADDGSVYGIGKITQETFRNSYFVDVEAGKPRQEHSDWRERPSNIDHGHMCPAADCKWSKEVMNQSFLLTNMCPQNHDLNEGDWATLEDRCRKWAIKYGEIYIVAGPIFYDGVRNTFGANKIAIPDAFFKVILCMQGSPKTIGFIFKNDSSSQPMRNQVKSVDEIEEITGFDFFSALPDEVEDKIEASANINNW